MSTYFVSQLEIPLILQCTGNAHVYVLPRMELTVHVHVSCRFTGHMLMVPSTKTTQRRSTAYWKRRSRNINPHANGERSMV